VGGNFREKLEEAPRINFMVRSIAEDVMWTLNLGHREQIFERSNTSVLSLAWEASLESQTQPTSARIAY